MSVSVSRWMTVAAAVAGLSHEKRGQPCQDAVYALQENNVTVVALADGAGSVRYARQGAECATRCAGDWIGRNFDTLWDMESSAAATAIVGQALERLGPLTQELSAEIRELASTLAFVAVKQGRFIAGNLGDGVIGCERQGQLEVLCHPQRGEFANQTYFLTSNQAARCFALTKGDCRNISAFSLMSDGTADAFYQRRDKMLSRGVQQVSRWLEHYPVSQIARQLEKNLREQVRIRTDDDCSLAVLRRLSFSLEALAAKSIPYQRDFLACGSSLGARNRLQVLQAMAQENTSTPTSALTPQNRCMTRRTLQRHRRALDSLLEFDGI
jgi:hypothetical protein